MPGYIADYTLDFSPSINALNYRLQDNANKRQERLGLIKTVGGTIGNMIDTKMKMDMVDKSEIDKAKKAGADREWLIERYPNQKKYINGLFQSYEPESDMTLEDKKDAALESDWDSIRRAMMIHRGHQYRPTSSSSLASEAMLGYHPNTVGSR